MVVTYSISPAYIQGPLIAATVFGVLATLSTALRLYAMHLKGLKPGISEFFLLFGVLLMYGALSLLYIMTKYGVALIYRIYLRYFLGLVKTSIALFMVRIFGTKDGFKTGVIVAIKKIGLTSVFGVGIVISVISIIRLISIYKLNFDDPTYTLLDPIMWTVLEPQLAIICANMPFFKTIIAAFAPAMGSSADRKYGPGVSSGRTFDRLGHSENNGTYSMDPLDTKTHTVNVGHSFDSSKTANADVESVSSEEQRLASNASPYGINVIQKFDVEYEKASVRG
ncbi:hypothetical protein N7526_004078 [Penicillium atrosanguineum]|nr:hypothetical protein N7526_004078 [Penicillium atrosanguineum]